MCEVVNEVKNGYLNAKKNGRTGSLWKKETLKIS